MEKILGKKGLSILYDNIKNIVNDTTNNSGFAPLRQLYLAAGALYNDTDNDIIRTDAYGESINHKPGCYYLNGLGDITEEEMAKIYHFTGTKYASTDLTAILQYSKCRTNFVIIRRNTYTTYIIPQTFMYSDWETIDIGTIRTMGDGNVTMNNIAKFNNLSQAFLGCTRLRKIYGIITCNDNMVSYTGDGFQQCNNLEEVRIHNLNTPINFSASANLSLASIQYMIENAANTSNITITLHATAYARVTSTLISTANQKNITIARA